MKKIYYFSSIIFLYTLFVSCGKGFLGDARVDGIVKDKTTGEAIAGATVYLLESENDYCLFCPTATFIIDSTTSDNEGCFEFKYDDQSGFTYSVNAIKEHYIDNQLQTYINSLGSGVDVEVLLDPEAFLKVRVHNVNTYDPWDYLSFSYTNQSFYGNEIDTILIFQTYGNLENRLVWGVVNDGDPPVLNNYIHLYCPAFDTTYFEILY